MIILEEFDMIRIVRAEYCYSPTPGIISDITSKGIQFRSKHIKVNVRADGTVYVLGQPWLAKEAIEKLEAIDKNMAQVVKNTLEKFKKMKKDMVSV